MITSSGDLRNSDLPEFRGSNGSTLLSENLGEIFEDVLGALFIVNRDGIVEYANKKYLEIFRISREDVVGKEIKAFRFLT